MTSGASVILHRLRHGPPPTQRYLGYPSHADPCIFPFICVHHLVWCAVYTLDINETVVPNLFLCSQLSSYLTQSRTALLALQSSGMTVFISSYFIYLLEHYIECVFRIS